MSRISSHTVNEKFEAHEHAVQSEIHTISIYPALEDLGFRVYNAGFRT